MAKKKKKNRDNNIAENRKAFHNYEILEDWEAGIALYGSEVKSMRQGKTSIADSYAVEENGEIFLINSYVAEYTQAGRRNHDPHRKRKLLLHRSEINKIVGKLRNTGLTLVPLAMYFNAKGLAKVKIALAKGKTKYDKREAEKKRDWEREKRSVLKAK